MLARRISSESSAGITRGRLCSVPRLIDFFSPLRHSRWGEKFSLRRLSSVTTSPSSRNSPLHPDRLWLKLLIRRKHSQRWLMGCPRYLHQVDGLNERTVIGASVFHFAGTGKSLHDCGRSGGRSRTSGPESAVSRMGQYAVVYRGPLITSPVRHSISATSHHVQATHFNFFYCRVIARLGPDLRAVYASHCSLCHSSRPGAAPIPAVR